MKIIIRTTGIVGLILLLATNCDKDRGFIITPISQEVLLGQQLDSTIIASPNEYPILDKSKNAAAYAYLEGMMHDILNNDAEPLKYKSDFDWKITIINKNELNAFAAPGGYLYFYTGLIKYLDRGSELAGVLAHEIAHADLRHSAQQMQKTYGINFAAAILFGTDQSQLEQILIDMGSGLASLQFSRSDEYQADEFSIRYLAGTKYDPLGVTGFFEQLLADGQENASWELLSTHPSGGNRIAEATTVWKDIGSPTGGTYEDAYADFINLLP